jgi:hypothetical protein
MRSWICFVAHAPRNDADALPRSRDAIARPSFAKIAAINQSERGLGAQCTRQPRVRLVIAVCTRAITAEAPEHPAFPAMVFNGLLRAPCVSITDVQDLRDDVEGVAAYRPYRLSALSPNPTASSVRYWTIARNASSLF